MADVFSSSLAARLLNKPVAHASTLMDNLLPLVILLLSMTLIATSVIRRALEKGYGRRPKWARHSWKAFAALRRQLEASEVPALKSSWLQAVYEQEAKEVQEDDVSPEEGPRRKRTQRRSKSARTSHVPAGRAGAPEAAEPTASELEEQPQSSSESDVSEVIHKIHVEAVVTSHASEEEESTACDEEVAEAAELEAEAPAEEAEPCGCAPVPRTSEEEMIYSAGLLLAHREICLRIARGAPGLRKPEGCAPTEDAAPLQEAKETSKEKSPKKAAQPAVQCTPEELQEMEPPMRKAKIVVGESDLTIYVNADQSRYQIYRNGREMRSVSWGGSSASRLRASWKKVLEMAAPLATRKGSPDLLEP